MKRLRAKRERLRRFQALTVEQRAIVTFACANPSKSILITGSAGTGKSVVLRAVIEELTALGTSVYVTGSTGVAACNVGGTTLHSFAGIGLGKGTVEDLLTSGFLHPKSKPAQRWRSVETLVIDEVSMTGGDLLDKLDGVARELRKRPKQPFGGVRLIMTGDPLQLAAIPEEGKADAPFFFESATWAALNPQVFILNYSHRQSGDAQFAALLNELRLGVCSPETQRILELRLVENLPPLPDGTLVTHLMPHNADVDAHNAERLQTLPGGVVTFTSTDWGEEKLLNPLLVPSLLELKVGAQVMLLKNLSVEHGLYNGLQGVVTAFEPMHGRPMVKFEGRAAAMSLEVAEFTIERNKEVVASRTQLPLRLSWATTIHKSQASTITTAAEIDAGPKVFAPGMTYVALSRLQRLDQLRLRAFSPSAVKAHPRVVAWLDEKQHDSSVVYCLPQHQE